MTAVKTVVPLTLALFLVAGCGQEQAPVVEPIADEPAVTSADSGLLPHQELARELLRELIEIDTTDSVGDNTAAAQAMANHLLAAGFPAEDVQVLGPVERKGNLVARYRGRDSGRKPLLLLAHIDVVEADPADWTLPPFTFTEEDGYYYGRGTTDNKDEAAIHIANFIRMKDEGFLPDRDIIVALTADEEGGNYNGVQWLLENHRDLIDAEYALNEGGGGSMNDGRRISNNVQASEKVYQTFTLEVTNPGGHSSTPVRENAIYQLAAALVKLQNYDFKLELSDTTRAFFAKAADIDAADKNGGTALIWAVAKGEPETLRLLIAAGADLDARDSKATSALALARRKNRADLVEILEAAGAKD